MPPPDAHTIPPSPTVLQDPSTTINGVSDKNTQGNIRDEQGNQEFAIHEGAKTPGQNSKNNGTGNKEEEMPSFLSSLMKNDLEGEGNSNNPLDNTGSKKDTDSVGDGNKIPNPLTSSPLNPSSVLNPNSNAGMLSNNSPSSTPKPLFSRPSSSVDLDPEIKKSNPVIPESLFKPSNGSGSDEGLTKDTKGGEDPMDFLSSLLASPPSTAIESKDNDSTEEGLEANGKGVSKNSAGLIGGLTGLNKNSTNQDITNDIDVKIDKELEGQEKQVEPQGNQKNILTKTQKQKLEKNLEDLEKEHEQYWQDTKSDRWYMSHKKLSNYFLAQDLSYIALALVALVVALTLWFIPGVSDGTAKLVTDIAFGIAGGGAVVVGITAAVRSRSHEAPTKEESRRDFRGKAKGLSIGEIEKALNKKPDITVNKGNNKNTSKKQEKEKEEDSKAKKDNKEKNDKEKSDKENNKGKDEGKEKPKKSISPEIAAMINSSVGTYRGR